MKKLGLNGGEEISWGGSCRKGPSIQATQPGNKQKGMGGQDKERHHGQGLRPAFTDGSKLEGG